MNNNESDTAAAQHEREKWSMKTMQMINELTTQIKGKAFDPGWFLLRERFEAVDELLVPRPAAELAALKAELAEAKRLLDVAGMNCRDAERYGTEAEDDMRKTFAELSTARTERDALRARVTALETLLRDNAVQWSKEVAEILAVPAMQPASETGAVRVFGNSGCYFAWVGKNCWDMSIGPGKKWTHRKSSSMIYGPESADAFKVHCCFDNDRELTPAEVAALLRAHPLPPEAGAKGAETEYERMSILAKPGDKVVFDAGGGRPSDVDMALRCGLVKGTTYTVRKMDVGSWSSDVYLEEVSQSIGHNTTMFAAIASPAVAECLQIVDANGKPLRCVPWAEVAKGAK